MLEQPGHGLGVVGHSPGDLGDAVDPGAEAAKSYAIEATGPATLQVGATGTLVLAIKPVAKTHVHPQAPLKISLSATPGLALSKTALGRKDLLEQSDTLDGLAGSLGNGEI